MVEADVIVFEDVDVYVTFVDFNLIMLGMDVNVFVSSISVFLIFDTIEYIFNFLEL